MLKDLAGLAELSLAARKISAAQKNLVDSLTVARREALVDPLLRIWNRGGVDALTERQNALSRESATPFSVLLIDIDHFKQINDSYGHHTGDMVLKLVVRTLSGSLRTGDELGRYGGDEFLAVLPNTSADGAELVAGRLNRAVASLRVEAPGQASGDKLCIGCTVSIGIVERLSWPIETAHSLVRRADAALLTAKRLGRNAAMQWHEAAPTAPTV